METPPLGLLSLKQPLVMLWAIHSFQPDRHSMFLPRYADEEERDSSLFSLLVYLYSRLGQLNSVKMRVLRDFTGYLRGRNSKLICFSCFHYDYLDT